MLVEKTEDVGKSKLHSVLYFAASSWPSMNHIIKCKMKGIIA